LTSTLLPSLNEQERALAKLLRDPNHVWRPQMGPQMEAWLTDADELYYGGQAGGGKTDLLLGLGLTAHRRSIIFRRNFTQFKGGEGLIQRSLAVVGTRGHFSSRINGLLMNDGRTVEFAGVEDLGELGKWKGRPHDLCAFDELSEFLEQMYTFLGGWVRTTVVGQRTRIVGAGNPPTSVEGEWVIRRWGAWLDNQHSHPAKAGELRWYARIDDKDTEVEDGQPFEFRGELITPKSRTFIPASLKDNPILARSGYAAQLQAMPEPLRSQLLFGDYTIGLKDDPWQIIPSAWVEAAMRRWHPEMRSEGQATCAGLDVARGGGAKTVLAQRWGNWFAPLQRYEGKETPDGQEGRRIVVQALLNGGYCNVDVIGPGAAVVDLCREVDSDVVPVNFGAGTKHKDRTNLLRFLNVRAFAYWSMREALDPEKGDNVMLPPDTELKADLCAPRWMMRVNGIQVEDKDEIVKRIGRSPDAGDAVVLAAMPPLHAGVAFY
jgi:hypothetical protein